LDALSDKSTSNSISVKKNKIIKLSTKNLTDGKYKLYAIDIAGNLSTANGSITIDTIAPKATLITKGAYPNTKKDIQVKSSEKGIAYLVETSQKNITTKINLEQLVSVKKANKVNVDKDRITSLSAKNLTDSLYILYTVDIAGNVSTGTTNSITIDNIAPKATLITTGILPSSKEKVQVKSNETGTAYLVNTMQKDIVTKENLDNLVSSNTANKVHIYRNVITYLPTTGLDDARYQLYTVDEAGNVSDPARNSVTIENIAYSNQPDCPTNDFNEAIQNAINGFAWYSCKYQKAILQLVLYRDTNLFFYRYIEDRTYTQYLRKDGIHLVIETNDLTNLTNRTSQFTKKYELDLDNFILEHHAQKEDIAYATDRHKLFTKIQRIIDSLLSSKHSQLTPKAIYYREYITSLMAKNTYTLYVLLRENYETTLLKLRYNGLSVKLDIANGESPFYEMFQGK